MPSNTPRSAYTNPICPSHALATPALSARCTSTTSGQSRLRSQHPPVARLPWNRVSLLYGLTTLVCLPYHSRGRVLYIFPISTITRNCGPRASWMRSYSAGSWTKDIFQTATLRAARRSQAAKGCESRKFDSSPGMNSRCTQPISLFRRSGSEGAAPQDCERETGIEDVHLREALLNDELADRDPISILVLDGDASCELVSSGRVVSWGLLCSCACGTFSRSSSEFGMSSPKSGIMASPGPNTGSGYIDSPGSNRGCGGASSDSLFGLGRISRYGGFMIGNVSLGGLALAGIRTKKRLQIMLPFHF